MTLYWYVQNKDEVLDLVADRMLADVPLPAEDVDWQTAVREVATSVRAALIRHGGAVHVMLGRGSFGPNGLRIVDHAIRSFRVAGFGESDSADAYFAVSNFVNGFAAQQTAGSFLSGRPGFDGKGYFRMVQQYIEALPVDRYPNLRAAAPRIFSASLDERFSFGLDCLIGGLEAKLAVSKSASQSQGSRL